MDFHEMDLRNTSRNFWLPSHLSWENLFVNGENVMPPITDLLMCIPGTLLLILIRYFWERKIVDRLTKYHISKNKYSKRWNDLEKSIDKCEVFNDEGQINYLLKESNFSRRQVERYLRDHSKLNRPDKIKKIRESAWLGTFYSLSFLYGLWCVYDKEWFSDPRACWLGWPLTHLMPNGIYWYYVLQISFYLALTFAFPFDVKRKDSSEMLIHHLLTLSLLFLSYGDNFYRMGSMVLILHDPCDIFLYVAKMAEYFDYKWVSNASFVAFSFSWLILRLIIFPYTIVFSCVFDAPALINCDGCPLPYIYYIMCLSLCLLQILHVIWFYFILKRIKQTFIQGGSRRDCRSDSESSDWSNEKDTTGLIIM